MQRRKTDPSTFVSQLPLVPNSSTYQRLPSTSKRNRKHNGLLIFFYIVVFVMAMSSFTMVSIGRQNNLNYNVKSGGKEAKPPTSATNGLGEAMKPHHSAQTTKTATEEMLAQPSSNVDGEKALKKKLKKIMELQRQGKEKDALISTRYIGEDIQYWISNNKPEAEKEEWNKEMKRRTDLMKNQPWYNLDHSNNKLKSQEINSGSSNGGDITMKTYAKPTTLAGNSSQVLLKPTFGTHRSTSDAVFAFAEGYDILIYLCFIQSLVKTGFSGDLVISVSAISEMKPGVEEYLRSKDGKGGVNIVVYTTKWICYNGKGEKQIGSREGVHKCQADGIYGQMKDGKMEVLDDAREARPVATARYELYWAWSLQYENDSWLMLIDSRDTYFQRNPFDDLSKLYSTRKKEKGGRLLLFAENAASTKIKDSSFNSNWLRTAYGKEVIKPFQDQPVICSGSTMGEKIALESYLRAMVTQFDETKCKLKGCDQGFHNYLYYSKSLHHVSGISEVKVFQQGTGIVNNLGLLRTKPLKEWKVLDADNTVLNWDGSVSAVAHQFDRDGDLNKIIKAKKAIFRSEWSQYQKLNRS